MVFFKDYTYETAGYKTKLENILAKGPKNYTIENLSRIVGLVDFTTLNVEDNEIKVESLCKKINGFKSKFPELPNVAAFCINPLLVDAAKSNLATPGVKIAAVSGGFPLSQTFTEIKVLETEKTIEKGADEIDIVQAVGRFLLGDNNYVYNEIKQIKNVMGLKHLKVILETACLPNSESIQKASVVAIQANADFIKTSTGKNGDGATREAIYLMCRIIKQHFDLTGNKIGIKPAGGISRGQQAIDYFTIVKEVLGEEWLTPELFRIGASRLVNNLLSEIHFLKTGEKTEIKYF